MVEVVAGAEEAVDVDRCPASSFSPRAVADLVTAVLLVINNRREQQFYRLNVGEHAYLLRGRTNECMIV